jgi:hypothetical protein
MVLIKSIVIIELEKEDRKNPNPLLSVKLDHAVYMVGLNMLQNDRGFSSREKLLNSILREIAKKYGLIYEDSEVTTPSPLVSLKTIRKNS